MILGICIEHAVILASRLDKKSIGAMLDTSREFRKQKVYERGTRRQDARTLIKLHCIVGQNRYYQFVPTTHSCFSICLLIDHLLSNYHKILYILFSGVC